ncbi:MAG: hypothetical protein JWR89_1283, partial [Tardiphaga sp.]|nr:hypothetical protein [Tardiphaga sp.]
MRAAAIAAICLLFAHAAPARAAEFVARAEVAAK